MKNCFLLFVFGLFLMACSSKDNHEKKSNDNALLNAPSVDKQNRLNDLYIELKEQRPELQSLEQEISAIDESKDEALKDYKLYDAKNEQVYNIAKQYVDDIKDSLLSNSIELLINKSQYAYEQDNAAMSLAEATLEGKSQVLHDHQKALKVILTLRLLEKYQKKQLPNSSVQKKIMDRYNNSIRKTDSLLLAK